MSWHPRPGQRRRNLCLAEIGTGAHAAPKVAALLRHALYHLGNSDVNGRKPQVPIA